MKTPNLGLRLHELYKPVFVMWGLNDQFCPESHARLFLEACPDVRSLTFARTGHWVQVERAEEFNRYAIQFLDDRRFTANQIEFVNLVVDHLCENGLVSPRQFYESPFTDISPQGPDALFEAGDVDRLFDLVEDVRLRAHAA